VPIEALPPLARQGPATLIDQFRGVLDMLGEPHPAFELGLRWLTDHAADLPERPPALVHGDFRNGNFIVGPEGLRAVLDWELAHLGDPIEDLGWFCVKSWRFGNVAQRAGGFGPASELLAVYEDATGHPVEPEHLHFWEVFGTLKWGVICEMQTFSHLNGLVRSVELAALGRRVAEQEWDLLELLDPSLGRDHDDDVAREPAAAPTAEMVETVHDRPTITELVGSVREYLERDVMAIEGRVGFHAASPPACSRWSNASSSSVPRRPARRPSDSAPCWASAAPSVTSPKSWRGASAPARSPPPTVRCSTRCGRRCGRSSP